MPTALKGPFRPMEDVLGKRSGIATQTQIRRAPDFADSMADRSKRIADIVRAGIEQDPSEDGKTSFMHAPMNVGRSNPYGDSIDAWEPNTEIFDQYERVYTGQAAADGAEGAAGSTVDDVGGTYKSAITNADGKVSSMINAAMGMVGKYYVWGGTTSAGVDCSGLIYYAFNAAGINMPRYRAVDYRNMGTAVDQAHALPGDIVYIDEPGDTDHVGIYIGNGQMIQSPHTGARTAISNLSGWNVTSIRRVLSDSQLGQMAAPPGSGGGSVPSYAGKIFAPVPAASTSGGTNRWL